MSIGVSVYSRKQRGSALAIFAVKALSTVHEEINRLLAATVDNGQMSGTGSQPRDSAVSIIKHNVSTPCLSVAAIRIGGLPLLPSCSGEAPADVTIGINPNATTSLRQRSSNSFAPSFLLPGRFLHPCRQRELLERDAWEDISISMAGLPRTCQQTKIIAAELRLLLYKCRDCDGF